MRTRSVRVSRLLRMLTETFSAALFVALRKAGFAAAIALGLCAGAHAQAAVQKCHIDGRIVFQSGPCPLLPSAVVAADSPPVAANVARKKTLADLLREREAAAPARPISQPLQADGANVLRSRMGAL